MFNRICEELTGYGRQEALGEEFVSLLVPESWRDIVLARFTADDPNELAHPQRHPWRTKFGDERLIEWRCFRASGFRGQPLTVGVGVDTTDRHRAEILLMAQHAIMQTLVDAPNLAESARSILKTMCDTFDWQFAALWTVDAAAQELRCMHIYSALPSAAAAFEEDSRRRTFKLGVGLPGGAWEAAEPTWIEDVGEEDAFRRATTARLAGLRTGFAFPMTSGSRVLGVIEAFTVDRRSPDTDLMQLLATIGHQLGLFLERKQAEEQLAVVKDELASDLSAVVRLHDISTRFVRVGDVATLLDEVLDAAIAVTGAGFGNLQLVDFESGTLQVVAQRGFTSEFVEFFNEAHAGLAACDTAMLHKERIVVEDVRTPSVYTDAARDAMLAAGVLACQSTPLFTRSGEVLGMISTHFRETHRPSERELRLVDLFARHAADLVEHSRAQAAREALLAREQALREQAEAANLAKDEFLAMLGHELRNPLASILTSARLLRTAAARPELVEQAAEVTERQASHLARLLDDLLDAVRIARGKIDLRNEVVRLASVVEEAVDATRGVIERQSQVLRLSPPEASLVLVGDRTRLVQIVVNLLDNASKYSDPSGCVEVSARREGDEAVLRVRDTGIGIDPELLPRVFELFAQGDSSLARAQGGLGIGLTLVRRLVELHGGTVEARSEGRGKGSEFIVRLPLLLGHEPPPAPAEAPSDATRPRHVLIIEDNADARAMLALALELEGHRVEVAEDGAKGIEMAAAGQPDVVVMDIGLPDLDGYEVGRRIRAKLGQQVCLVAVTGYGQREDQRRAREAGFDAHLVKPVATEELLRVLIERGQRRGTSVGSAENL